MLIHFRNAEALEKRRQLFSHEVRQIAFTGDKFKEIGIIDHGERIEC